MQVRIRQDHQKKIALTACLELELSIVSLRNSTWRK